MSVNSQSAGDQDYHSYNHNVWEPPCFKRKCATCAYKLECANYQSDEPIKWACTTQTTTG